MTLNWQIVSTVRLRLIVELLLVICQGGVHVHVVAVTGRLCIQYIYLIRRCSVYLVTVCNAWSVALTKSLLNKDEITASHFSSVCDY